MQALGLIPDDGGGRSATSVGTRVVGQRSSDNFLQQATLGLAAFLGKEVLSYTYFGVMRVGSNKTYPVALFEFSLDAMGFPVKITFGKTSDLCYDMASLEARLKAVLMHPDTGGKLVALMEEPAAEPKSLPAGSEPPQTDAPGGSAV